MVIIKIGYFIAQIMLFLKTVSYRQVDKRTDRHLKFKICSLKLHIQRTPKKMLVKKKKRGCQRISFGLIYYMHL